jgi:hypothetical protein
VKEVRERGERSFERCAIERNRELKGAQFPELCRNFSTVFMIEFVIDLEK